MSLKQARLRFFSDALVLKTLSHPDSLGDLDKIRKSLGITGRRGKKYFELFNGYKLTLGTALYCVLDGVIAHPSLLALNDDQRLWEWWVFTRSRRNIPSRVAFSSPDSGLANFAVRFDNLLTRVKRADKWDSMQEVAEQLHSVGDSLGDFGSRCSVSFFKKGLEQLETQEALRRGAIERLDDYLEDGLSLRAYQFAWGREEYIDYHLNDMVPEDLSEMESHLDYPPLLLQRPRGRSRINWTRGRKIGICIALDRLRPAIGEWPTKAILLDGFIGPNDLLTNFLSKELKGEYPSMAYGLRPAPVSQNVLALIISAPAVQPEDRLRALVGGDSMRLVASGPVDALDFKYFIRGIVPDLDDDSSIEVVRVRHARSERSSLTWFSLAVRIPRFGLFSNFSKWWGFYKAYGLGWMQETDSEVRAAELVVGDTLKEFGGKIKLTELEGISSKTFLGLFEPPAWTLVFNGVKDLMDRNSDITGVFPELLASVLLSKLGYSNIRTSYKPAMLEEERELDALGIKSDPDGGECLIIETKGQSTTDRELAEEVEYFGSKLRMLRERLPDLADEIGYTGEINSISGIFVSMAQLGDFKHEEPDVTFWDFNAFVAALRAERIPGRLLDLLEPSPIFMEWSPRLLSDTSWVDSNDWDVNLSKGLTGPGVEVEEN